MPFLLNILNSSSNKIDLEEIQMDKIIFNRRSFDLQIFEANFYSINKNIFYLDNVLPGLPSI